MALPSTSQWRVRAGGNVLNGGGFDPAPGDGTDYTDSDTPILSFTDLSTTGAVTTVTTAAGGVTAAMKNNYVRLASGTNAIAGYYKIESVTNANTFVLDRTPASGAMSGGVGRIGGAFATPWGSLASGGSTALPVITTPLAAGHTVYVRGGGLDVPVAADYTMPAGFTVYPSGSFAVGVAGLVRFIGYNGRPRVDVTDMFIYSMSHSGIENFFLKALGTYTYPEYGLISTMGAGYVKNITFEQNGVDKVGAREVTSVIGCRFQNSGATTAGTHAAISVVGFVDGCFIDGWRGSGIDNGGTGASYGQLRVTDTVIANCRSATVPSIRGGVYGATVSAWLIRNVTVYGGASDGIELHSALYETNDNYDKDMALGTQISNCLFVNCGGYGVNFKNGATTLHDRLRVMIDHNAFYGCVSGRYNRLTDGANDIILSADPFVDAVNGNFELNSAAGGGALVADVAFPEDFPSA